MCPARPRPPSTPGATPTPSPAHIRSTIATIVDQPDELKELRVFHKALADVNRLRIVQRLAHGPSTVSELIDTTGLSQPLVSWHVSKLKAAGIVRSRRAGRETLCELRPEVFDEEASRERALLGLDSDALGALDARDATEASPPTSAASAAILPATAAPAPAEAR